MDVRTSIIAMALASTCASLLLVVLNGLRFWAEGTRQWARGYAFIACGLMGLVLRPFLPPLVSFVAANVMTLGGYLFLLDGIRRFTGRSPLSWEYGAVLVPAAAILTWFTAVTPSMQARTLCITVVMAAASALMAHDLLVGRPRPGRTARHLTGVVAVFLTLHAVVRVVLTVAIPPPENFFAEPPAAGALILTYLAFLILFPSGLILMVAEKLQADVTVLRGLLPICSYCRRVRDDTGYWNEIEAYVRAHAGTQFSHGICPTCYDTQFRDLEDEAPAAPPER